MRTLLGKIGEVEVKTRNDVNVQLDVESFAIAAVVIVVVVLLGIVIYRLL